MSVRRVNRGRPRHHRLSGRSSARHVSLWSCESVIPRRQKMEKKKRRGKELRKEFKNNFHKFEKRTPAWGPRCPLWGQLSRLGQVADSCHPGPTVIRKVSTRVEESLPGEKEALNSQNRGTANWLAKKGIKKQAWRASWSTRAGTTTDRSVRVSSGSFPGSRQRRRNSGSPTT